ncbi:hypothetical protein OPV22_006913 [Ensete ventricosum]|uniref:Uncharacterized protein n=1 Tax=Ensete ventricosum TaxID=4639 RepID=A0AAV8RMD8_ENSVE|nr:hypothetical protein OPV22_006913 [Ensete ventricosum]
MDGARILHQEFDCCFSLHVHSIDGLPSALTGAVISVHWRRTTDPTSVAVATRPIHILHGAAQELKPDKCDASKEELCALDVEQTQSLSLWSNRLSCNLVHEGTEEESQVREGTEESHMLNPCILPELVKRSDERECDEPGFMAIGDVVEIALEDQMCKTRTEPEKMGV